MKQKKGLKIFLIVFLCAVFTAGILIYGIKRQNSWNELRESFNDKNEEETELVSNLELLENFDIITNLEFFEDITNEGE
ncbi:MAG: hypothetical protein KA120_06135 [Candidatus Goldbacteria bacterium]|nr:hypothetical protein [Candidatus Goldiibacteriota bacterium]